METKEENWSEVFVKKFCTYEGEERLVFKNKITADEAIVFINTLLSTQEKKIKQRILEQAEKMAGKHNEITITDLKYILK